VPAARKLKKALLVLLIVLAVAGLTAAVLHKTLDAHLRAASLLIEFSSPDNHSMATRFARHPVAEQEGTAAIPGGPLRYRTYAPQDLPSAGGVVLLHGVHHLGIDDPRMVNLSRALAAAGVRVMTPELQDLADYRVTPEEIDTIGQSAVIFATLIHQPKVGVMGLSFAGGLSLLAAKRPEYASHIGYVLAIGAHDDMERVSHFFAANLVERPDGSQTSLQAHEYGVLVLAYAHLEDFFSPRDVPIAREALRHWLWEQPDAMKTAEGLSPRGREQMEDLLHHRDLMQQRLLKEIDRHREEMAAVSPHNQLGDLSTPVYLLHGAGDNIIPATETLWLSKDVPQQNLRAVLVSAALTHVDMGKTVAWQEKWQLVDFMAQVLEATDELGRTAKAPPAHSMKLTVPPQPQPVAAGLAILSFTWRPLSFPSTSSARATARLSPWTESRLT